MDISKSVKKVAYYDNRIVQKDPVYKVNKGALSISNSPFSAITKSSTNINFSVQVPSLNVFMSREVGWTGEIVLRCDVKYDGVDAKADEVVAGFGETMALSPFPLHKLVNSMSATINDTTTTITTSNSSYCI